LLTALLVFGATPAVLSIVVGDPLRHGLGHQWDLGMRVALTGLALVAWVAWAVCSIQLARAVVVQVRRGDVDAPEGALLTERVAARIAAGVLSLMALLTPLALSSGAGATSVEGAPATAGRAAPAAVVPSAMGAAPALGAAPPVGAPGVAAASSAVDAVYVVRPGDSLWSIAATQLGDGDDWPAIAALNLGRTMPGGLRFVDPNRIYAGWSLQLPDQATVETAAPSATTAPGATSAPAPAPAPAPARAPVDDTAARRPLSPPGRRVPSLDETLAGRLLDSAPRHAKGNRPRATRATRPGPSDRIGQGHTSLPELATLGIGAIGCAALARRVRRVRVLRQVTSEGRPPDPEPTAGAIDTDVLLARFDGVPALRAFEAANYRLDLALNENGPSRRAVNIRAVCVGASGVDFWLAVPGQPAPAGFTLSDDGTFWRAGEDSPTTAPPAGRPILPIVLPVGEDDAGTWLVPLEPGACLPLVGDAAADLWCAARAVQEAWPWADAVLVTDDAHVASEEARLQDHTGDPSTDALPILFFGDPTALADSVTRHVAIVTLLHARASDVTVVVDRRAASIHPLGRTVQPHLMRGETAALIRELVTASPQPPMVSPELVDERPGPVAEDSSSFRRARFERQPTTAGADGPVDLSARASSGTVEVKLLTPTPRIDGLCTVLPPNRARRSVELVAYLALHLGDEITSDRLRTRVLGSADADAASKTLFNVATAARRALGTDADGMPLFPPGTRAGHYRVTEGVTVDVQRVATLAAAGSATEDPDAAMDLLRAALSLVEGEPLANALSGYAWWEAEGHGARIAAVLVNAASDLAALAVSAGRFDLAQWGLSQARLADPYSEAISRAAMQVAAAAGDADRLRREWRDCQRRMDELDPGSAPSPRTERLYGELAQRVLVGAAKSLDR
jgi:DNA-binding SARP family transcriptional activator